MKKFFAQLLYAILFLMIFIADRITKFIVLSRNFYNHKVARFLTFDIAYNRGISWGMFDSKSSFVFLMVSLLIVVMTIFLGIVAYFRFKEGHTIVGEVMAIAGSCSNITDRILYGGVIDFISLHYGKWFWPVFNVADLFIVMGIVLIFLNRVKND